MKNPGSLLSRGPGRGLLVAAAVFAACREARAPAVKPVVTPAATAPPSSLAIPKPGALLVTAPQFGAAVFLDGRRLGEAPQRAEGLVPGAHDVRVVKEGFRPFQMEAQILAGHEARIQARLEPEGTRLRVDSDVAGAQVFLDRKPVGTTPLELEVTPGSHRLNVSAEGYEMHAEDVDLPPGRREVMVRFREVRLDEGIDVVHKHGIGSCQGRLTATPAGIRYRSSRREDDFSAPMDALERLEVDYLGKTLRVGLRGGRTYKFTTREQSADGLLVFQKRVDEARRSLTSPEGARGGSAGP